MASMEDAGRAIVKGLFKDIQFDITTYCYAAIDEAYEYCIKEFKKACEEAGIDWKKEWEKILYGE